MGYLEAMPGIGGKVIRVPARTLSSRGKSGGGIKRLWLFMKKADIPSAKRAKSSVNLCCHRLYTASDVPNSSMSWISEHEDAIYG